VLLLVVGVPQLRNNEQILSRDDLFIDRLLDAEAGLDFVRVERSLIDAAVADLDRVVDNALGHILGNFPAAEAALWHLSTRVQGKLKLLTLHIL
jgi:hypothetical protein